ncbi:hypothetical protein D9M68_977590 [compost metagenome]
MGDQGRPHLVAETGDDVEYAGKDAAALDQFRQFKHRRGCEFRRLGNKCVSRAERRRHFPGRQEE